MTIIFFGNTKHSLIGARIIHENLGLSCIVTIPDRPDKKGNLKPSPLKTFAEEHNIPVFTVNKLDDATIQNIAAMQPDFFIVEDYGLILPEKLLSLPRYASLNIHHSLLPKYRGPSPAPAAILAGEKITGVSIITMTKKVDAGDILAQKRYAPTPDETTDSLLTKLNQLGGEIIIPVITSYLKNTVKPIHQQEKNATYTKQITKQGGFIDIVHPLTPEKLDRMIRAYFPWPTVWTRLRLSASDGQAKIVKLLPGQKIQVEGKKPMGLKDFYNGYPEVKEKIDPLFQ